MRRSAFFACLLLSFPLAACGGGEENFSVRLSFEGEAAPTALSVQLCGADGWSIGTAQFTAGENSLPLSAAPCYLACELPKEYDCPVVYADGEPLSLAVSPAEYSASEGGYLHTYTVFLQNAAEGENYTLQMCLLQEGGFCKRMSFESGVARLPLADGTYSFELISAESGVLREDTLSFSYTSSRFCVIDLNKE